MLYSIHHAWIIRTDYICFRIITRKMVTVYKEHPLMATENEIDESRSIIFERIGMWRAHQQRFMPTAATRALTSPPCEPENESLYLPSDFTILERSELLLTEIAEEEADL